MKRVLFVALLALALPMAAFANSSTDFSTSGGTLGGIGNVAGVFNASSTIIFAYGFNGGGAVGGANLGSISFTTGALMSHSGSIWTYAGGGSFTITGSGSGLPGGVLFSGTFKGPVTLEQLTDGQGFALICEPTMGGCSVTGKWWNGQKATGAFTMNSGGGLVSGMLNLQTGVVPEPGTLSLLGSGLLGLGLMVRRKLRA